MHAISEVARRQAGPTVRFEIDPDPCKLRATLEQLSDVWRSLEHDTGRRVRALAIEVIGRSSDLRRHPRGSIRLEITVLADLVRIEASGAALLTPSRSGKPDRDAERLFPDWAIVDLADRWAVEEHTRDPAVWFEIDRHPAQGLAA